LEGTPEGGGVGNPGVYVGESVGGKLGKNVGERDGLGVGLSKL
jgi:hypothetical protein